MKTLAEFKRKLAVTDITVSMSREIYENGTWVMHEQRPELSAPRKVAKLQTNAVAFATDLPSGASWLWFGSATEWAFNGNQAIWTSENANGFGVRLTYTIHE
jgi:hypothetical protein